MSEHPKEYAFACDCCDNKCKVTSYNAIPPDCGCLINPDIGAIWKFRPHPAPDTPASKHNRTSKMNWDGDRCVCNEFFNCHDCRDSLQFNKEHDAAIVAKAREDVLDKIMWYMVNHGVEKRPEGYYVISGTFSLGGFIKHIESLRSTQQQAGEP